MTPRAAFFDLDGTLIRKPSSELRFLRHLCVSGPLGARQLYSGLAFYPRWFRRFGWRVERVRSVFHAAGRLGRLPLWMRPLALLPEPRWWPSWAVWSGGCELTNG